MYNSLSQHNNLLKLTILFRGNAIKLDSCLKQILLCLLRSINFSIYTGNHESSTACHVMVIALSVISGISWGILMYFIFWSDFTYDRITSAEWTTQLLASITECGVKKVLQEILFWSKTLIYISNQTETTGEQHGESSSCYCIGSKSDLIWNSRGL